MFKQYLLRHDDHRLTCWLEVDTRVRVGSLITLKNDDRVWEVLHASSITLPTPPEKRWRVGGLL